MRYRLSFVVYLSAVVLGMATTSRAVINTTFFNQGVRVIGATEYIVWDMVALITGSGADWTNARLDVNLFAGALYQHPQGGHSAPNPALIAIYPDLEYDTYVTAPGGFYGATQFAGPVVMSTTQIGVSWFDTVNTGQGFFQIARLTLSRNATGTIGGLNFDSTYAGGSGQLSGLDAFDGFWGPRRFSIAGGMILGASPFLLGDTNLDGVVDLADYNNVVNNLGGSGLGDTNNDGVVDLADYNNVVNNLGSRLPSGISQPAAAPEPSSLFLSLAALAYLVRGRRGC